VQVDLIKPILKPPGSQRLKPTRDKLLSRFAFNLNLRRYNLEQVSFAAQSAVDTVQQVQAMAGAAKQLKTQFKSKEFNLDAIDRLNDEMADLMDYSNEIQVGASQILPATSSTRVVNPRPWVEWHPMTWLLTRCEPSFLELNGIL